MIKVPITKEEIQIFAHNQGVLRELFREKQHQKYCAKNEKQRLYECERRRFRKSALSNF
jgi:hypothetical protein